MIWLPHLRPRLLPPSFSSPSSSFLPPGILFLSIRRLHFVLALFPSHIALRFYLVLLPFSSPTHFLLSILRIWSYDSIMSTTSSIKLPQPGCTATNHFHTDTTPNVQQRTPDVRPGHSQPSPSYLRGTASSPSVRTPVLSTRGTPSGRPLPTVFEGTKVGSSRAGMLQTGQ